MKRIFSLFFIAFFSLCGCEGKKEDGLSSDRAYFFYAKTCPHCHHAEAYISQKYPDVELTRLDVATPEGERLFLACAEKFKLGQMIGAPLFCLGNNYLMGWGPMYEQQFDSYIEPFLK